MTAARRGHNEIAGGAILGRVEPVLDVIPVQVMHPTIVRISRTGIADHRPLAPGVPVRGWAGRAPAPVRRPGRLEVGFPVGAAVACSPASCITTAYAGGRGSRRTHRPVP